MTEHQRSNTLAFLRGNGGGIEKEGGREAGGVDGEPRERKTRLEDRIG